MDNDEIREALVDLMGTATKEYEELVKALVEDTGQDPVDKKLLYDILGVVQNLILNKNKGERLGCEKCIYHSDYTDGDEKRILCTRNKSYFRVDSKYICGYIKPTEEE